VEQRPSPGARHKWRRDLVSGYGDDVAGRFGQGVTYYMRTWPALATNSPKPPGGRRDARWNSATSGGG
jgi:hypothetical protein